jgi:hypothetical protein
MAGIFLGKGGENHREDNARPHPRYGVCGLAVAGARGGNNRYITVLPQLPLVLSFFVLERPFAQILVLFVHAVYGFLGLGQ